MKNIFLTLFRLLAKRRILAKGQIIAWIFLFGPFASQGAARASQESRLTKAIVFEMFEAIKSGDSKAYEGLFYDLAANLKASGELKRLLLSAKDERGNNIFHLMAGASPESPAGLFFQHEIMNLLLFFTLPDSLKINHHVSLGGMAYSEMPKALQSEKGSMSIDSVIRRFLETKNKEGQTPELIARNSQNPITANNFHQFAQIPVIARSQAASAEMSMLLYDVLTFGSGVFVALLWPLLSSLTQLSPESIISIIGSAVLLSATVGPITIKRLTEANKCRQAVNGQLSSLLKR